MLRHAMYAIVVGLSFTAAVVLADQSPSSQPPSGGTYSIKAEMIDADAKAQRRSAAIVVTTNGIKLVDPASANEMARTGEGHLHYRIDDGPVIATTATKLSFHEIPRGAHKITVMLAANDHSPLSGPVTFTVTIP